MSVRPRWPLRLAAILAFGLVASAPFALSPSLRSDLPRFELDPQIERIARFLEWRAPVSIDPSLRRQVAVAVTEEARYTGLDPLLILSVMAVESDFIPDAISGAQAKGLMQLRDVTVREIVKHEKLPPKAAFEPEAVVKLRLGIRYLALMVRRYPTLDRALAAWNAGPGAVDRALARTGRVPQRWLAFAHRVSRENRRLRLRFGVDARTTVAAADRARGPAAE